MVSTFLLKRKVFGSNPNLQSGALFYGPVDKRAKSPAFQAGVAGFKSRRDHHYNSFSFYLSCACRGFKGRAVRPIIIDKTPLLDWKDALKCHLPVVSVGNANDTLKKYGLFY